MVAPAPSKLDQRQILQAVLDEEQGRLRVDAVASISNVSIAVDLDPTNDGVYVADKDTGNKLVINADGSINAVLSSVGGAATPSIQNVTILTANIENMIVLPLNTKRFQIRVRDAVAKIQLAYTMGDSSVNYITIPRGCNYSEQDLNLTTLNRVLYIQSNKNNIIIECMVWV
jgi:DNA-binding beta-propeller fold protein YncE